MKNSQLRGNLKLFISRREESGEIHGAELIEEIKKQSIITPVAFSGLGGTSMQNAGVKILYHTNELSTIGFVDVIKKINFFNKVLKKSLECIGDLSPDCIILIDYPGFNLKFAEKLRKFYKGKIFYYISPQIWAWHKKRVFKIKKYISKMLVVFPFEENFYKKYGVDAVYVGHPLVKKDRKLSQRKSGKRKKIFGDKKTIAILPGSRKDEINNHLPVLLKTAKQLSREFDLNVNISKSKGVEESVFKKFGNELIGFNLTEENSYDLIYNSDLVLTKAGTSTVECALIGTPFIIFYKTFPFNYYLLKPVVKVDKLGMVNILSNADIVKEFIQKDFNTENLLMESRKILTETDYRNKMKDGLLKLWDILGDQDASANAAKIILNSIV